jgi:hypothetical protein
LREKADALGLIVLPRQRFRATHRCCLLSKSSTGDTPEQRKVCDTAMNSVLALAELAADLDPQGFQEVNILGSITSGNSDDSNNCGSDESEGC